MSYGRVWFGEDGEPLPMHRWDLVEEGGDGAVLVSFSAPEGFWARQAPMWEEQTVDQLGVRADRLRWLRDSVMVEMAL